MHRLLWGLDNKPYLPEASHGMLEGFILEENPGFPVQAGVPHILNYKNVHTLGGACQFTLPHGCGMMIQFDLFIVVHAHELLVIWAFSMTMRLNPENECSIGRS